MSAPDQPIPTFPELERLERAALSYAWTMLYLGIGVGFVLAWIMCSAQSCVRPREPVVPRPVAPAPQGARAAEGGERPLAPTSGGASASIWSLNAE